MNWSPAQANVLDDIARWKRRTHQQQVYRLFGYAGTGKTTLAKAIAQDWGGNVLFAAPTGKAASVMASKGCNPCSTIHSLIYQPRDDGTYRIDDLRRQLDELSNDLFVEARGNGDSNEDAQKYVDSHEAVQRLRRAIEAEKSVKRKPIFELKMESELKNASLLMIDETSMINPEMAEDLLSFGCPIIALGDPAQLPPVKGEGYFMQDKPDALLTEIHRQAEGDPIIDLATKVRNGQALRPGQYGESRVMFRAEADKSLYLSHDQMIVGTNKTVAGCNRRYRELLGLGEDPHPVPGDRLICLRNNHDKGLLNGTMWRCDKASQAFNGRMALTVSPFDSTGSLLELVVHEAPFLGAEVPFFEIKEAESFKFGYAITCHKSQGSQWDNVLILDESEKFSSLSRQWLYTAITRAAKKVTVVI